MVSISRRRLAQIAGGATGLTAANLLLPATMAQSTPVPAKGGTLRAAFVGAGAGETLEPWNAGYAVSSFQRSQALYEPLIRNHYGVPSPVLAESWEPASDGLTWTIRLRPDVFFHDGQSLTSTDVLATFAYHLDPDNQSVYGFAVSLIDIANSRTTDDLTVELAMFQPLGDLGDYLANSWIFIFPANHGNLAHHANGTGAFRLESFIPGDRAVLVRNENYWGSPEGGPFLDALEILSIDSPEARVNALLAGQIDFAENINHSQALALQNNDQVELLRFDNPSGRAVMGFAMNVTSPPFADPRVREGMKLLINRQSMIDIIGLGFGSLANDILITPGPDTNVDLPQRAHDPERAAALFAEAGVDPGQFALWTSPVAAGYVESATLWADQLATAGFQPAVEVVPPDTYFVNFDALRAAPMKTMSGGGGSILTSLGILYTTTGYQNFTGYSSAIVDQLHAEAMATSDTALRHQLLVDLQAELWSDGPDIAWGTLEVVHAISPAVRGVDASDTTLYPQFDSAYLATS